MKISIFRREMGGEGINSRNIILHKLGNLFSDEILLGTDDIDRGKLNKGENYEDKGLLIFYKRSSKAL